MPQVPPFPDFLDANGYVKLHHYGPRLHPSQLPFVADPQYFITNRGPWSQAEFKADKTPKTFFYLRPEDQEHFFTGRPLYTAKYPGHKIYDLSADPKKIVSRLAKYPPFNLGRALAILKRLGYHGVHYNFDGYGPPLVAMWNKVQMEGPHEQPQPHQLAKKFGSYGYCPTCNAPFLRKFKSGTVECPRGHRHPRSQSLDKPRKKKMDLARQRAPQGGIIVNSQFFQGGKFLPRAFKRIRDAVASKYKLERKKNTPGILTTDLPLHMEPVLRGVGFDPKQHTLHIDQLKKLEEDHQIPQRIRLSTRVKTTPTGHIHPGTVSNEKIYDFLDAMGRKRLSGLEIRKRVQSPDVNDPAKLVYLINHLAQDAQTAITAAKATGGDDATAWYGSHVEAFDKGLHHIMTGGADRHPLWGNQKNPGISAGHVLAKAILALTSGGQNPVTNTGATVAALRSGQRRAGEHPDLFSHIPDFNIDALADWKARAGNPGPPGVDPAQRARWYVTHVLGRKDLTAKPGYKSTPAVIYNRPGHPNHGTLLSFDEGGHTVPVFNAPIAEKYQKKIDLPLVDQNGELLPKGWTLRGQIVAKGLKVLKNVIAHNSKGVDPITGLRRAAKWLLEEHPEDELLRISGLNHLDRGYLQGEKKLPGAFVLGPKFGPFFMNLNSHGQHLTADMWFSRTWNRYLNSFFETATGHKKPVEAPRSKERKVMYDAARKAAQKAGLNSIAELQAVLWYYEQNYWRWFGADTKSYSYLDGINAALDSYHKETGHAPATLEINEGKPEWTVPKDRLSS